MTIVPTVQRLMVPLLRVMVHPRSPSQARVSIVDDPQINAGSAGSGEFLVTTGLLRRANDERLQAVLTHEIAPDDLGHVSQAQTLGTGLSIATGSSTRSFRAAPNTHRSRAPSWLAPTAGMKSTRRIGTAWRGGGGFFSTHPDTGDGIQTLRKIT